MSDTPLDDIPPPGLAEASAIYREAFGDCPTIMGLAPDKQDEAAEALMVAVEDDEPFEDDAAFYEAIGMTPPPDDADI